MKYLRSLLFNFFVVFFANYLIPGVDVVDQTKLPHIGGDLIFAVALGFLNSLVYPILKMFTRSVGFLQLSIFTIVLNFAAYALLKVVSIGVFVTNVKGYLLAAFLVSLGSCLLSLIRKGASNGNRLSSQDEEIVQQDYHRPDHED